VGWRAVEWVLERSPQTETAACAVLVAIARHADDEGKAWPSVATIARLARLSERHVKRILRELEASGELVIERGGGRRREGQGGPSHRFTIVMSPAVMATAPPLTNTSKGDIQDRKG